MDWKYVDKFTRVELQVAGRYLRLLDMHRNHMRIEFWVGCTWLWRARKQAIAEAVQLKFFATKMTDQLAMQALQRVRTG